VAEDKDEPTTIEPTPFERSITGATVAGEGAAPAGASPWATVAAFAGAALPFTEIVAGRVFDEFRADARARVDDMLAAADKDLGGGGPDKLADRAGHSAQKRLITAMAVDAAASTAWPVKVIALGRVLAAGLVATDEATLDDAQLALRAMADMERLHASLLELLVRWQPRRAIGDPRAEPYAHPRPWGGKPIPWQAGQRKWTYDRVGNVRPQLRPLLPSLMGTLQRHGLAVQNDATTGAVERYAATPADDIHRRAMRGGGGLPTSPAAPLKPSAREREMPAPTWSPTELGERVLGFYLRAAELAAGPSQSSSSRQPNLPNK